jgi:hypothetical protein
MRSDSVADLKKYARSQIATRDSNRGALVVSDSSSTSTFSTEFNAANASIEWLTTVLAIKRQNVKLQTGCSRYI